MVANLHSNDQWFVLLKNLQLTFEGLKKKHTDKYNVFINLSEISPLTAITYLKHPTISSFHTAACMHGQMGMFAIKKIRHREFYLPTMHPGDQEFVKLTNYGEGKFFQVFHD